MGHSKEFARNRVDFIKSKNLDPIHIPLWHSKYGSLKLQRGDRCKITFEDYITLAVDAGIKTSKEIGTSRDSFCLGRLGDVGDYEVGNCRFIKVSQNQLERTQNGGADRQYDKMRGRTKATHEGIMISAIKHSKTFELLSPTGEVFMGINLTEFCKNNNLNQGSMSAVCRGDDKSHKKWTGRYIGE